MTTDNTSNNNKDTVKNDTTLIDEDVNSKSHITVKKIASFPSEEEHKAKIQEKYIQIKEPPHPQQPPKQQQQQQATEQQSSAAADGKKHTIIRESLTRKEYDKAGIPLPYSLEEDRKETFERQTKGNWTRKVTSITYYRDLDEQEFLDWNEERTGHTDMKRKITEPFNHVGQYEIPVPQERVEYDPDNEENRVVVEDRPKEIQKGYHLKFSKSALQELLNDCNPRSCEFIIAQEGQRAYTVTKKELERYAGDFDTLFALKADPNFKITGEGNKK